MRVKKIAALVMSAAVVLGLTACGGGSGSSSSDASASKASSESTASSGGSSSKSSADKIIVNIWDNNQLAGIQAIADEWSKESGVGVQINVIDWDNYWTLLEAGARGGEMPDVFWMHSNTAQMYMENDLLLNLDDYIKAEGLDMSKYYDGIVKLYQSGGHQYALPKDHDTIALLYNEKIFKEYGVDVPTDSWSWADVEKAAAQITEKSGGKVYGFAMNTSNNQDGWYNLVEAYGGHIVTEDHKSSTLGSDQAKAGMEQLRKILVSAAPQSVVAETGTDSLFASGQAAMITQGSWMINFFYTAENHADYKWAMIPYGDANGNGKEDPGERASCYNGLGWAVSANTVAPEACYSLISYFCSEAGQKKQAELGVTMGGMKGISEAFASAFDGMDVSAFTKVEEVGTLYFRPYTRNTTVWEDKLQQAGAFLDPWQDPSDPAKMATACENAQKIIEDAIAAE